jgi:hypothetical protein
MSAEISFSPANVNAQSGLNPLGTQIYKPIVALPWCWQMLELANENPFPTGLAADYFFSNNNVY